MVFKILFCVAVVITCVSCESKDEHYIKLQAKIDSLQEVINGDSELRQTMREVGSLMDSVDAFRKMARNTSFQNGESLDKIAARMKELAGYVKTSQQKIEYLDRQLHSNVLQAKDNRDIRILKKSLEEKDQQLSFTQQQVILYANQNDNLIHLVGLQKLEIDDKLLKLRQRTGEDLRQNAAIVFSGNQVVAVQKGF